MWTAVVLGTNLVVGAVGLTWVLAHHGGAALALLGREPRPGWLAAFVVAIAAVFVVHALRWRLLLAGLGTHRMLGRLTAYRAAGQSLSSLVPSGKLGGEPLRAFLLARDGVTGTRAIASVAVDRALEIGAAAPFAFLYAALLLRRGVPELEGALASVTIAVAALAAGIAVTVRRLRRREGLVTAVARSTGLGRLRLVRQNMEVLEAAEEDVTRLIHQPGLVGRAFALGLGANVLVFVEYHLLLAAFGLPASPLATVAVVFATGAAHSLPVPAAVGVLEGAQIFVLGTLGHSPEVGLAVGLAVRLRELIWVLPGLVYLAGRALVAPLARWRPA